MKLMPKAYSSIPTKEELSKFEIDPKIMNSCLENLLDFFITYKVDFDKTTNERTKVWYRREIKVDMDGGIKFRLDGFRNREFEKLLKHRLKLAEKHFSEALENFENFKHKVLEDSSQERTIHIIAGIARAIKS